MCNSQVMPIIQSVDYNGKFSKAQYQNTLTALNNIPEISAVIVFNFKGHIKKMGLESINF